MKAYVRTYGCTLNQADSDIITAALKNGGAAVAEDEKDADVLIFNTCTVKKATSQKILYTLNRLSNSNRKLVVTGCMAGANRDLIEKYAPNASIITIPNVGEIASVASNANENKRMVLDSYSKRDRLSLFESGSSIIAKVPVNDGCLSSCSFCETKPARGPLNSFSEELILKAIRNSVEKGAKEIQLTSQDIGAYGMDKRTNIAQLMNKIALIDGDFKVRIGMLNPEHLGKYLYEFLEALKSEKFYRFVHLPIQSGSNKVLKEMKRNYTVEEFNGHVEKLRESLPELTIETDIIVGFPTETENDFEKTLEFIGSTMPEVTNISRYSARPHASSSKMSQLPYDVINSRSHRLSRLVREVQHKINDRFIGKRFDVILTESNSRSINGRNRNYRQVVIVGDNSMQIGSVHNVLINAASANVLYA